MLRQLDLTLASTDQEFILETDVGPNGEDPCAGDSGIIPFVTEFRICVACDNAGGPLLLEDGDKDWTLVGVLRGGGVDCLDLQYDTEGTLIINDATSEWSKISVQTEWIEKIILTRTPKTTATTEKSITSTKRVVGTSVSTGTSIILTSSGGPAAEWVGGSLGLYDQLSKETQGCKAFQQRHTLAGSGYFLYKEEDGKWTAGRTLGGNTAGLRNTGSASGCQVPTQGWEFYNIDEGDWFPADLSVSQSQPFLCTWVTISGTSTAAIWQSASLGLYSLTRDWNLGRPVYLHKSSEKLLLGAAQNY